MDTRGIGLGLIVAALVVTACATVGRQKKETSREPSSTFTLEDAYNYSHFFNYDDTAIISCHDFFKLLEDSKPKPDTVLAALQVLKSEKEKIFSRYVLLPNSLSIQKSNWQFPRAIVYSGDGQIFLSFNGESSQVGYGQLEVMCFQTETSSFEFREIFFPKESKELEYLTAEERKQPFVISPINGYENTDHDCRRCHQENTRPNWDSYPIWPSAYGAFNDALTAKFVVGGAKSDEPIVQYTARESEKFKNFVKEGRYSVLDENAFVRPNLAIGKVLSIRNAERVVGDLKRLGRRFEKRKIDFAKALYCPLTELELAQPENSYVDLFRALPEPMAPEMQHIIENMASTRKYNNSRLADNFDLAAYPPGPYVGASDHEAVIRLAHVEQIMKPLGVDIKNWSLVLGGGYDMEDGSGSTNGTAFGLALDMPFLNTFFPNDSELIDLVKKRRYDPNSSKRWPQRFAEDTAICKHLSAL